MLPGELLQKTRKKIERLLLSAEITIQVYNAGADIIPISVVEMINDNRCHYCFACSRYSITVQRLFSFIEPFSELMRD